MTWVHFEATTTGPAWEEVCHISASRTLDTGLHGMAWQDRAGSRTGSASHRGDGEMEVIVLVMYVYLLMYVHRSEQDSERYLGT